MRSAPTTKSLKRSDGPVDGPIGSSGPGWPPRLKYGPAETITGVLSVGFRPFGRRMSACSWTPSVDGIVACDQSAPGGTSAAPAAAGTVARGAGAEEGA